MQDFLWTIIGWICKGVSVMALLVLIIGVCHVIKFLVTNGNRNGTITSRISRGREGIGRLYYRITRLTMSMNGILKHAAMNIRLPANRFMIVNSR